MPNNLYHEKAKEALGHKTEGMFKSGSTWQHCRAYDTARQRVSTVLSNTQIIYSCSGHKIAEHGSSQLVYVMVLLMLHPKSRKYLEEKELAFKFLLKKRSYPKSLL